MDIEIPLHRLPSKSELSSRWLKFAPNEHPVKQCLHERETEEAPVLSAFEAKSESIFQRAAHRRECVKMPGTAQVRVPPSFAYIRAQKLRQVCGLQ
jgi:hypothetical protein